MSYKIVAKYIKDLNFVIDDPKNFFLLTKNISNYKIKIDIKSKILKEKTIEVDTTLSLNSTKSDFDKIDVKIVYSAIVELGINFSNKKELEKIILINVPTEIYPNIREIFILLFEKSGFKDVKIEKIVDFEKLYLQSRN
jgi:preprotein translocase subunit SecB|tara:strand:+ start:767 stop:1183 length:417 start_codon:yes stop_codon:yes gene_type:complete